MPEPFANSLPYADTVGLLLAGGVGARMGHVRKTDLRVGGRKLGDLARENLSAQCGQVFEAVANQSHRPKPSTPLLSYVADPGRGPGAALLHSILTIRTVTPLPEYVFLAPCDAPFMPKDFVAKAREEMGGTVGTVIGNYAGQDYPTHALWHLSTLTQLQGHDLGTDSPSLFALLDLVEHRSLAFARCDSGNPFLNVNSTADLLNANRLALAR